MENPRTDSKSTNTNTNNNTNINTNNNNNNNTKINNDNVKPIINNNLTAIVPRLMDAHTDYHNIYTRFQARVNVAVMNHTIFTVYGQYHSIRKELRRRGWLEKCSPNHLKNLNKLSMYTLITNARKGNDYEVMAISKFLDNYKAKFYWLPKNSSYQAKPRFTPYINFIKRDSRLDFTSKDGLMSCIDNTYWNIMSGTSEINVPRYHRFTRNTEHIDFLEDYRITYCLSLLQYIRESHNIYYDVFSECGTIPINIIDFALTKIRKEISNRKIYENDSIIKNSIIEKNNIDFTMEWMSFYYNVDHLVNGKNRIKIDIYNRTDIRTLIAECIVVMKNADKYWPLMKSDGYHNLWIIKPASACRGWGITIKNNFENILGYIGRRLKTRYIIQKYIEHPLLIYNTKFDIRQYILLTITPNKFNIWMYKKCYLRFSSQEYNLINLNESVHITNNSVQKKYKNGERSSSLPANNMWTLKQFEKYLTDIGQNDIWNIKIYPGMKKNVITIILTSLEETEIHTNLFELYGCDFMISENFEPILIEINGTPDMSPSTTVTSKLCPAVLIDLIKVVIDLPQDRKANTGQFELIHSIPYTPTNAMTKSGLEVIGKKIIKK